jgi:predicted nucleic acid-binding protein
MTEKLFDTSVLVSFLQGGLDEVLEQELTRIDSSISVITLAELCRFYYLAGKGREWEQVKGKISQYNVLPVTNGVIDAAGKVASRLPLADSLIYATALEHGLTLVTRDSDFKGLPGVQVIK